MNTENTDDLSFLLITPTPQPPPPVPPAGQKPRPTPSPIPIPIGSDLPFPPGSLARECVLAWMKEVLEMEADGLRFSGRFSQFWYESICRSIQQALQNPVWFAALFTQPEAARAAEKEKAKKDRAARGAGS